MKDYPSRYSNAIITKKKLKRELQFMGIYEKKTPFWSFKSL
jgi:hypothetical protein